MDSRQDVTLLSAINCVNRFLKLFNLKEVEAPENIDDVDSKPAIEHLARELLDVVEQSSTTQSIPQADASVTQITASNKELDERIQAFMAHAQNVIDEQNVKEFCDSSAPRDLPGCARTDACYQRRMSNSTHMQVSRASNSDGPQLKVTCQGIWSRPPVNKQLTRGTETLPHPIAERLNNLETHLNMRTSQYSDVYTRLKNLENKVLAMEGTSPEYFSGKDQPKTNGLEKDNSSVDPRNLTLQEIDDRIRVLKQKLSSKKRKVGEEIGVL